MDLGPLRLAGEQVVGVSPEALQGVLQKYCDKICTKVEVSTKSQSYKCNKLHHVPYTF